MRPEAYRAAARRLRHYADRLDRYADPRRPRDLASLTRIVHSLSLYAQRLSMSHRAQRHLGNRPRARQCAQERHMTTIITVVDLPAAIRAGSSAQGSQKIELDVSQLTQDQREALLTQSVDRNEYERHDVPPNTPIVRGVTAHTQEEVLRVLDMRVAERAATQAAEAEKNAQRAAALTRIAEWARTAPVEDLADGRDFLRAYHAQERVGVTLTWELDLPSAASLAGREDEVRQFLAARTQLENAEKAQRAAAETAKREAGRANLRAWAQQSGSERLRKMLALDVGDWQSIAEREYMDAHAPAGYTYGCRSGDERRKPTLPEMEELERLRSLCEQSGGVLADPGLRWIVEEAEIDEESGEETPERRYCTAVVRITAPSGESSCYDHEIESE